MEAPITRTESAYAQSAPTPETKSDKDAKLAGRIQQLLPSGASGMTASQLHKKLGDAKADINRVLHHSGAFVPLAGARKGAPVWVSAPADWLEDVRRHAVRANAIGFKISYSAIL